MPPRLTILLPLKRRHLFTLRFLFHANRERLPYKFLIADGDVHEALSEVLENARSHFPNLDIEYVRYPDDRDFSCYYAKMADALGRVTTPYVMQADNDDFLSRSGIERALAFMETNADYVCCAGRIAGFSVTSESGDPVYGLRGTLGRLYHYYPAKDVSASSAVDRLRECDRCGWCYYAVFRANALATIWREVVEIDFSDIAVHEIFFIARAVTLGKIRSDTSFINYFRQFGTTLGMYIHDDWVHHLVRSRLTSDIHETVERVSLLAAAADNGDQATATENIRDVIQIMLDRYLRRKYGLLGELRHLKARMPGLIRLLRQGACFSAGRDQAALLRELAPPSQEYLAELRVELATIRQLLAGDELREFLRPYLPLLLPGVVTSNPQTSSTAAPT